MSPTITTLGSLSLNLGLAEDQFCCYTFLRVHLLLDYVLGKTNLFTLYENYETTSIPVHLISSTRKTRIDAISDAREGLYQFLSLNLLVISAKFIEVFKIIIKVRFVVETFDFGFVLGR